MSQQATTARPSVASTSPSDLGSIRHQAAVIRALLDELDEHAPPAGAGAEVLEQLAGELRRLGGEALRVAAAIERCAPDGDAPGRPRMT